MVCLLRLRGNAFRRQSHVIGSRSDVFPSGERESGRFCLHQDAALPLSSITFGLCCPSYQRRWRPQRSDKPQDVDEHLSRRRDLGNLEHHIAVVADDLQADIDSQIFNPVSFRMAFAAAISPTNPLRAGQPSLFAPPSIGLKSTERVNATIERNGIYSSKIRSVRRVLLSSPLI